VSDNNGSPHKQTTDRDHHVLDSVQKSLTMKTSVGEEETITQPGRRSNSVYVQHFGNSVGSRVVYNHYDKAVAKDNRWKSKGSVTIDGAQLAELFRLRPELSEYIHMEIQNARLSTLLDS
jgi:predicted secreted protein